MGMRISNYNIVDLVVRIYAFKERIAKNPQSTSHLFIKKAKYICVYTYQLSTMKQLVEILDKNSTKNKIQDYQQHL
jgi:hypothetical protein